MTITQELKQILSMEQNFKCAKPSCFNRVDGATGHAHHAIVPKGHTNYKKYKRLMDQPENLMIVCWQCDLQHGDLTNHFMRLYFYSWKIDNNYKMAEWYAQLSMDEEMFYIGKDGK